MYHTIKEGKNAIERINKVYPILEEIFNGRASMTRKEVLEEYSRFEFEVKTYRYGHTTKRRTLPTFETLRRLGLLVVIEEENKILYFAEDRYGDPEPISEKLYNQLPQALQDYCSERDFLRYHYELTPKEIVIEKILNSVNENFKSLMKLAD
jgi:hypothetical protein